MYKILRYQELIFEVKFMSQIYFKAVHSFVWFLSVFYFFYLNGFQRCPCSILFRYHNVVMFLTIIMRNLVSKHYDAEVYPNRHGQICPMPVSRVRFYYVNTSKVEQYCG